MPEGFSYLVAAYIAIWVGLLIYLGFIALRMRGVRTELVAVAEMVREQQLQHETKE
jgi:CcmD family protein